MGPQYRAHLRLAVPAVALVPATTPDPMDALLPVLARRQLCPIPETTASHLLGSEQPVRE